MRTIGFAVWLLLVAAVVVALAQGGRRLAAEDAPVARLEKRSGSVQVRAADLVRWRDAVDEQGLLDGDRVATGLDSSAKISLGDARSLMLGEDTQLQITAIVQANSASAFIVKILRGSVVASVEASCTTCPPIILRAASETINVTAGSRVGVFKAVGKRPQKFDPKGPWPSARLGGGGAGGDGRKAPAGNDARRLAAGASEADIASPPSGHVWWTVFSVGAIGGASLEFALTQPTNKPKEARWNPLVEISGADGAGAPQQLRGMSQWTTTFRIPVERIRRVATVLRKSGYIDYVFSMRGGATVARGAEKSDSLSARRFDYRIRTFGEAGEGTLALSMDKLAPSYSGAIWMEPKKPTSAGEANFTVTLASGKEDFQRMAPFVRGAEALNAARGALAEQGTFVVRRSRGIVAQLAGPGFDADQIRKMRTALGGDLVYKGARDALLDPKVAATMAKTDPVYALRGRKIEEMQAGAAVAAGIRTLFTAKVELIDAR